MSNFFGKDIKFLITLYIKEETFSHNFCLRFPMSLIGLIELDYPVKRLQY